MNASRKLIFLLVGSSLFMALVIGSAALAASSATIAFLDASPQPQYQAAGAGLVDEGFGCDMVTMLIADATGGITDIDTFCIDTTSGTGTDYTDWGSFWNGYVPVLAPITYTLFDTSAGDACDEGENSAACGAYLQSCAVPTLDEAFYYPVEMPAGTPRSFSCGGPAPVPGAPGCKLAIPSGSVVGDLPFKTQIYWSPGNVSPGRFINPGTYIVVGQDQTEAYYKIVLACQFIWVPKTSMQPSYLPPQNGAPLPTRIVS